MLRKYLQHIFDVARQGDAREESFYSSLEGLLRTFADSTGKTKVHVTTLPKKTEAGNPDFRIWDGKQHIIGYIEAKNPNEENLQHIETTDQLKRYRHTFPNLILTNFFEFRLYRNGQRVDTVQIARPFIIHKLDMVPPVEKEREFLKLLEQFFAFSLPKVYSAKSLAVELAKRTRFLKDQVIAEELREESERGDGFILGFYKAFQKHLISTLTKEAFADLYAQTITYGLFAARTRAKDGFNRKMAYDNIPPTIGILRDVFRFVSLEDLPPQMEWIVDDISDVLAVADVKNILQQRAGRDPIVHFYEPFLTEYDPKERERRGVYYTPEPVVSYIVRSLNHILKEIFSRQDGFASTSVRVLDPAAGTCTFPAEAAWLAVDEFTAKYGDGARKGFIQDHILKNFYAFELMMAPYAVGHLKIGFFLEELGHSLAKDERFKLYLTNTLEMEELEQTTIPGIASLAEESHLAGKVKKRTPILVILGNPPYSGISANAAEKEVTFKRGEEYVTHYNIQEKNGGYVPVRVTRKATRDLRLKQKTWIGELIEYYKIIDGEWFGERKHWLQDDYVKFIRFAQWKITQEGEGVLGFITNHNYLDNPTFRGMRQSLMYSFDEIYILDLHGNAMKREMCPDGSKDENVFDIQRGVAIALFVKYKSKPVKTLRGTSLQKSDGLRIYHADLWGLRESKYRWLETHDVSTTDWKELTPDSPYYFFVPRDESGRETYEKFMQVTDIFPVNVTGIVTSRDKFVIDFDRQALKSRIMTFRNEELPDDIVQEGLGLKENYQWRVSKAREQLIKEENWEDYFTKILYRPFDTRHICFHDSVVWRTRKEVMRHMLAGHNLGLIAMRQVALNELFTHVIVTSGIVDNRTFMSSKGITQLFPLYLYYDSTKKDLFVSLDKEVKKKPNLNPKVMASLQEAYGTEPTPEDVFHYIYAALYAPDYRTKYAKFIKTDFPRVPFTRSQKLFVKMVRLGKRLVDLHLLRSSELDPPIARFQGTGENKVENRRYSQKEKRVYINNEQYFEGIELEVWEYKIGGYQVLDKWLKDRKGRLLDLEDIRHYCHVVTALFKTISLQREIDGLYRGVEEETLSIVGN